MLLYFVRGKLTRVSATLILEVLSALRWTGIECPSCVKAFRYQSTCQRVIDSAMYSDSVVEGKTEFCVYENQEIVQPFHKKTYLVTERWLS